MTVTILLLALAVAGCLCALDAYLDGRERRDAVRRNRRGR